MRVLSVVILVLLAGAGPAGASQRGYRHPDLSQLYRPVQPLTDADNERRGRDVPRSACGEGLAGELGVNHGRMTFFSSSGSGCPGESGFVGSTDGKSIRLELHF